MATLPVRSHVVVIVTPAQRTPRSEEVIEAQRKKVRDFVSKRWSVRRIAKHMKISRQTVYNYLRKRTDY